MKIHEYQSKELFKRYGIPVPRGGVARTPDEATYVAQSVGSPTVVLKAQIHAGGRGKGGGIKVVSSLAEVADVAENLLGTTLVTPQTGPQGKPVSAVLVEEAFEIEQEIYVGVVIDRSAARPVILASNQGGMEIERVAAERPEKVIREPVNRAVGLRPFQANKIVYSLKMRPALAGILSETILNLYRLFIAKDCSLAEINPLVLTKKGTVVALDGKLNFDDSALYRQPDIASLRDWSQQDRLESQASRHGLNYIKLQGNVGCMVNGAGLAMATMDLIKFVGAEPANFLDVGGGATTETVSYGLRLLVSDPDVELIFINIFGGILRCDTVARGVVNVARDLDTKLPTVIRLEGTNVEEGRRIMAGSDLWFTLADGMKDAADKIAQILDKMP